ncbi:hypothetical protein AnigIFM56816_000185 [Aspergillus niger]|nr:hypothetical protein AnigIFM56816_000185 [Aspergillus niger]
MFVGDVLNNRDKVIDKLGHGAFSTIWLSRDERKTAYVAVKKRLMFQLPNLLWLLHMFMLKAMSMELSIEDFYEQFGKRADGIPPDEAQLLRSDSGESFSPSDHEQRRRGQNCPSPLPVVPPEAYFEPDNPPSFPSDIWSLA